MAQSEDFSLTGQVVDGKVVLDPFSATTEETRSAGTVDPADGFVAVNAPFDPESAEELELVEA